MKPHLNLYTWLFVSYPMAVRLDQINPMRDPCCFFVVNLPLPCKIQRNGSNIWLWGISVADIKLKIVPSIVHQRSWRSHSLQDVRNWKTLTIVSVMTIGLSESQIECEALITLSVLEDNGVMLYCALCGPFIGHYLGELRLGFLAFLSIIARVTFQVR